MRSNNLSWTKPEEHSGWSSQLIEKNLHRSLLLHSAVLDLEKVSREPCRYDNASLQTNL